MLQDFLDYNDFLDRVDALVQALELEGVLQVASFHPDYRFADSDPDDIENHSNRSPFPTLHLLREDSGTWRASFYHGKRRARCVVDSRGRPVAT